MSVFMAYPALDWYLFIIQYFMMAPIPLFQIDPEGNPFSRLTSTHIFAWANWGPFG